MQFAEQEIAELMESIWRATLDLNLFLAPTETAPCEGPRLRASVDISGAWRGKIILDSSVGAAKDAASIMFNLTQEKVLELHLSDATAELVNIVAGNIKGILPSPAFLSLPTVTLGNEDELVSRVGQLQSRISFLCEGESLQVTLLEESPAP